MKKLFYLAVLLTSSMIVSCQSEIETMENVQPVTSEHSQLGLLKDVASMMIDADNSNFIFDFAEMAIAETDVFETVYMSNLLNSNTRSNQDLASKLLDEINANPNKYNNIFDGATTRSTEVTYDDLENLEVEFYVPYSDNFESVPSEITVGYHPLVQEDWTDGYRIAEDGTKEYVPYIDDEYAQQNLTVIVMPKDNNVYDQVLTPIGSSDFSPIISPILPINPTTPSIPNGLIKENVTNSALIDEDDVLYTNIQAIRVNGTSWMKFLQTKQRLAIYRASSDIVWDENIYKFSSATFHKPVSIAIPRKDCRNCKWYVGNMVFDDDWDLHETNQKIFFVSEHNSGGNITLKGNVSVGLQNGVPSVEASAEVEATLTIGNHSILRAHNELIRKSILANNVGDLGGGTYSIDDTGFAIRRYGIVDIVFTFNYTKID